MDRIHVAYRKYDGRPHWQMTMRYLGEDEHGIWGGIRPGDTMRRGDEPPVELTHTTAALFPRTGWWTAWFNGPPQKYQVYCDITTPSSWSSPRSVSMVDLDLDVVRMRADESVRLLDEDEFAAHRILFGYPADVVHEAISASDWLTTALSEGRQPFVSDYQRWLACLDQPAGD
ncbi:MAG TPA: DUF402 domain-containing protein [Micromonosporaceae bacterium]